MNKRKEEVKTEDEPRRSREYRLSGGGSDWRDMVGDRLKRIENDIRGLIAAFWVGFIFLIAAYGMVYLLVDHRLHTISEQLILLNERVPGKR